MVLRLRLFCSILLFSYLNPINAYQQSPVVEGASWIVMHTKDQATFDSVTNLFKEEFHIPVFFGPAKYGNMNYFAFWMGNLVLEIVGPYPDSEFLHENQKTAFRQPSFRPFRSANEAISELDRRGIEHSEPREWSMGPDTMTSVEVPVLSTGFTELMYSSKERVRIIEDSLTNLIRSRNGGPLGFEYVCEIYLHYSTRDLLQSWISFLEPVKQIENEVFEFGERKQAIRFVESNSQRLSNHTIVFKVTSLAKARKYLEENEMLGTILNNRIEINPKMVNGLCIQLFE